MRFSLMTYSRTDFHAAPCSVRVWILTGQFTVVAKRCHALECRALQRQILNTFDEANARSTSPPSTLNILSDGVIPTAPIHVRYTSKHILHEIGEINTTHASALQRIVIVTVSAGDDKLLRYGSRMDVGQSKRDLLMSGFPQFSGFQYIYKDRCVQTEFDTYRHNFQENREIMRLFRPTLRDKVFGR